MDKYICKILKHSMQYAHMYDFFVTFGATENSYLYNFQFELKKLFQEFLYYNYDNIK